MKNKPISESKWRRTQEVILRERVFRVLQKQMRWVVKEAKNIEAFSNNTTDYEIQELLTGWKYDEELHDVMAASIRASILRGGRVMIRDLGLAKFGISWDLKNPYTRKLMFARREFELSDRQGTISSTTKERIKKLLKDGADQGLSYQQMSAQIREQSIEGVFSKARGEMIAVTEVGRAYGDAQFQVVTDFRTRYPEIEMEKQWITAEDDRVRPAHVANGADGWIPVDQAFSGTNEQNAPSSEFRCRCTFSTRILAPPDEESPS